MIFILNFYHWWLFVVNFTINCLITLNTLLKVKSSFVLYLASWCHILLDIPWIICPQLILLIFIIGFCNLIYIGIINWIAVNWYLKLSLNFLLSFNILWTLWSLWYLEIFRSSIILILVIDILYFFNRIMMSLTNVSIHLISKAFLPFLFS